MDPASASTVAAVVRGVAGAVSRFPGLPWWVGPVAYVAATVLILVLTGKLRAERAPAPISDGATAADRELAPARPGDAGPRTASDGSAAGDELLEPARPAPVTDQDDLKRGSG